MYITVPIATRPDTSDIEPFKIEVSSQSCTKEPFSLRLADPNNGWNSLIILSMSDKDFACLKRVVLAADEERHATKEKALAMLKAELEGEEPDPYDDIPDPDANDPAF